MGHVALPAPTHQMPVSFTRSVWFFATPWTIAHQAPLSMGFSRQEYWNGLPCPPPGDLPDRGTEPRSPAAAATAKSLQSCPTLFDPIDGSLPGSPVPGILQARTLEWVAISFSNAWKWKVKVKSLSQVWLLATPWTAAYQAPLSMGFSRQKYWSGVPLPSPASPANSLPPEPPGKLSQMPVADSNHWDWIQCPQGFLGGSVVKNPPAVAGGMDWIPDPGNLTCPCTPTIEPVL